MAFNSFVVYETVGRKIRYLRQTQAEADADVAADADLSAHVGAVPTPDAAIPGYYFTPADQSFAAESISDAQKIATRRGIIKNLLRELEGVRGMASWAHWNDNNVRAQVYARWVEMQARAVSIDSNVLDDTKYAVMLAEASIPGDLWYVLFMLGDEAVPPGGNQEHPFWRYWLRNDRSAWIWYSTSGSTTNSDSRGGIANGGHQPCRRRRLRLGPLSARGPAMTEETPATPVYTREGELIQRDSVAPPEEADLPCALLVLVPGGSREILFCTRGPGQTVSALAPGVPNPRNPDSGYIAYRRHPSWQGFSWAYRDNGGRPSGKFFGYGPDFALHDAPVNQVPYLQGYDTTVGTGRNAVTTHHPGWMRHTATFAHEIDTLYADHTHQLRQPDSFKTLPDMPHNDASNLKNQNGLQYGRGICGYNFLQLTEWAALRPEDGGTGRIATDWRMRMRSVQEDIEALCLACPHPLLAAPVHQPAR